MSEITEMAKAVTALEARRPQEVTEPSTTMISETSAALQAQARARVEAQYLVALRNPRDEDDARQLLLKTCRNPVFAEKVNYARKQGGTVIRGASIRLAEEAKRRWGNIESGAQLIHDDKLQRTYRVSATDLESNVVEWQDVVISKTVERKVVPDGVKKLSERRNSSGQMVYTIPADEISLRAKERAECQKAHRMTILALIPWHVIEEARELARKTLRAADAKDPDAAKHRLLDAYGAVGVSPSDLRDYLGHGLERISEAELGELRELYNAMSQGEASFDEALKAKRIERGEIKPSKSAGAKVRDKLGVDKKD